ncbi:MAG: hypothetical protein ACK4KW_04490 [Gemmobacter sp.]
MTRHVADKRAPSDGGRVRAFVDVARKSGAEETHPAVQTLAKRSVPREEGRRFLEFLRIARGREA